VPWTMSSTSPATTLARSSRFAMPRRTDIEGSAGTLGS
jgi:hypothetical protein